MPSLTLGLSAHEEAHIYLISIYRIHKMISRRAMPALALKAASLRQVAGNNFGTLAELHFSCLAFDKYFLPASTGFRFRL
jgi:hypothetical protein